MEDNFKEHKEEGEYSPLITDLQPEDEKNLLNKENSFKQQEIAKVEDKQENTKNLENATEKIKNDLPKYGDDSKLLNEGNSTIMGNDTRIEISYVIQQEESKECKNPAIICLYELPKYKNFFITVHPFIVHGYRIHHSLPECFKSIFSMHNETLNIWTHLVPFFIFLGIFIYNVLSK
jgi:hypothetical protein